MAIFNLHAKYKGVMHHLKGNIFFLCGMKCHDYNNPDERCTNDLRTISAHFLWDSQGSHKKKGLGNV